MNGLKKFLIDNIYIFILFVIVMGGWVLYVRHQQDNGLPSCTDTRITNTFTNVVMADVLSIGFNGPKPEVYDFKSVSYNENTNYCSATVTLIIKEGATTFTTYYKVYRDKADSSSYKVGFANKG